MTARQRDGTAVDKAAPDCAGRNGAQLEVRQYGYEKYVVIDEKGGEFADTHRRANARLIAAAPDLADCIHDLLYLHIAHHNHPLHTKARALLAKAEVR